MAIEPEGRDADRDAALIPAPDFVLLQSVKAGACSPITQRVPKSTSVSQSWSRFRESMTVLRYGSLPLLGGKACGSTPDTSGLLAELDALGQNLFGER